MPAERARCERSINGFVGGGKSGSAATLVMVLASRAMEVIGWFLSSTRVPFTARNWRPALPPWASRAICIRLSKGSNVHSFAPSDRYSVPRVFRVSRILRSTRCTWLMLLWPPWGVKGGSLLPEMPDEEPIRKIKGCVLRKPVPKCATHVPRSAHLVDTLANWRFRRRRIVLPFAALMLRIKLEVSLVGSCSVVSRVSGLYDVYARASLSGEPPPGARVVFKRAPLHLFCLGLSRK
jgi:hypothetical protein